MGILENNISDIADSDNESASTIYNLDMTFEEIQGMDDLSSCFINEEAQEVFKRILKKEERLKEDVKLKLRYLLLLAKKWPLNDDPEKCSSPENAAFLELEKGYCIMPVALSFKEIESSIPEEHRKRLEGMYEKVTEKGAEFLSMVKSLKRQWREAPDISNPIIDQVVERTDLSAIEEDFIRGWKASIIPRQWVQGSEKENILHWKNLEKSLRASTHQINKTYLVTLRLYYEMLLDILDETKHPELRESIKDHNSNLRLIDTANQIMLASKATHHGQKGSRLRKTEEMPVFVHPMNVTLSSIFDVVRFTIQEENPEYNPLILIIVAAIHDIIEDAELDLGMLVEDFLNRIVNTYDSTLLGGLRSGAGNDSTKVSKDTISLVNEYDVNKIKQIVRILSNNTKFTDEEKKRAIKQNIAGLSSQELQEVFKVDETQLKTWEITEESVSAQKAKKTFEEFKEEHDGGKLRAFLIRLNGLSTSQQAYQDALITKIEDRADNVRTLHKMPLEKQRRTLRATVTRLIAWIMLDNNNAEYTCKLYNSTKRLVDNTMEAYKAFQNEHRDHFEAVDDEYITKLEEWQRQISPTSPESGGDSSTASPLSTVPGTAAVQVPPSTPGLAKAGPSKVKAGSEPPANVA
jgi:hypothetical protein